MRYLKFLFLFLVLYLCASLLFYLFQERFIFQSKTLPADHTFEFSEPFEEVNIPTPDGVMLNGLFFHPPAVARGLIIYFHGNRGNLQRWGQYVTPFTERDYDILMVDYRGYGKSGGTPSEESLYQDAETIRTWVDRHVSSQRIVYYGRSLGAAMASHLASVRPPDLLILETPFDDLAGATPRLFKPVVGMLPVRYVFSNSASLAQVTCPKVILHGTNDWVVPLSSAERLKPFLTATDAFVVIPGGSHGDLSNFPEFNSTLDQFLGKRRISLF